MRILMKRGLSCFSLALVLTIPATAGSQTVGTSRADAPNQTAAFSIVNNTGVTIPYQVRWGDTGGWTSISLRSGHTETHSYPLGENGRAPAPRVRYDKIGGDGAFTPQVFHMQFHAVGYGGFGAKTNNTGPKK